MRGKAGIILALVCTAGSALHADDWPTWRGNASRTGVAAETAPAPLGAAWTASLPGRVRASPVVADGRCFAATDAGFLYALSALDGAVLWSFQAGGPILATPAVDRGVVFAGALDGSLYALNAASGALLWQRFHGGAQVASPLVDGDRVIVAVGHPSYDIRAYAVADGAPLWSYTGTQLSHSSPALVNDGFVRATVTGDNGSTWTTIDPLTGPDTAGAPLWSLRINGDVRLSTAVAAGNGQVLVCPSGFDPKVYVLDLVNKTTVRSFRPTFAGGGTPAKAGGALGKTASPGGTGVPPLAVDAAALEAEVTLLHQLPVEFQNALRAAAGPAEREAWITVAEEQLGQPLPALRATTGEGGGLGGTGGLGKSGKPADGVPQARFSHSPTGGVETSSPALDGGKVYLVQRDKGLTADVLVIYRADVATGVAESGWSAGNAAFGSPGYAASPAVSGGSVYVPFGGSLHAFAKDNLAAGPASTVALPAPSFTSPAVSDGRVFVGTDDGKVMAFQSSNNAPGLPAVYAPAADFNLQSHFPVFTWSGHADPDPLDTPDTLTSEVEYSLLPDLESGLGVVALAAGPGVTQVTAVASIPANTRVYWRVRIRDAAGARSPWSPVQQFWVFYDPIPPDPPISVSAVAFDAFVELTWVASGSSDVTGYNVYTKTAAQSFAQATVTNLGNVTSATIGNLINNTTYDFMVTAHDYVGNESAGVVVTATPRPDISIDGSGNFLTIQQALDAAAPGQSVVLGPKTFNAPGGIVIQAGVALQGYAPHLTIIHGNGAPVVIRVSAAGKAGVPRAGLMAAGTRTTIENLVITGGGVGIDTGDADVLLKNLTIAGLTGDGFVTGPAGALEGVALTIADNGGNGAVLNTPLASVRGSIFAGNDLYGVQAPAGTSVTYSSFFGNTLGTSSGGLVVDVPPDGTGTGNLFVATVFENPALLNYREKSGEPAVDAGHPSDPYALEPEPNGARINQGAFGNTPFAMKSQVPIKGDEPGGGTTPAAGGGGGGGGGGGCFVDGAGTTRNGLMALGVALVGMLGLGVVRVATAKN
jgi:outer membrane protein assembly factor BamB